MIKQTVILNISGSAYNYLGLNNISTNQHTSVATFWTLPLLEKEIKFQMFQCPVLITLFQIIMSLVVLFVCVEA